MATGDSSSNTRGAATRARILAATAGLLAGSATDTGSARPGAVPRSATVTVSAIARAAGVYPNQITHHFGSKDRLVLDASFVLFLRDTARLQAAGRRARTADGFRRALARTALAMPSTTLVVHALGTSADDAQRARVRELLAVLFRQSERYLDRVLAERSWSSANGTGRDARTFWSAVFGAVLLSDAGVAGGPSDVDLATTVTITAD